MRELVGEERRHGVSNLRELLFLRSRKRIPVGKTLQPCGFAHGEPTAAAVGKADAVHVTRATCQVAAGQGSGRLVGTQVARAAAVRRLLVGGDVAIHGGCQELGVFGNRPKRVG